MKVDSFFSLKDYFNYYISGFVWVVDFFLLGIILQPTLSYRDFLTSITFGIENLGVVFTGFLLLLVPYIVGFVLFPICQFFRRIWEGKDRNWFPSPRKWLIIRSERLEAYKGLKKPFLKGSRLSTKEVTRLVELAEKRFGLDYKTNINLLFHPVRTYVLEYGGASAAFAERMRDLMSLSESLLFPISLFAGLIFAMFTPGYYRLFGILLAILIQYLVAYRYHRIEIDWVKRIYRSFLAIESKND